ncbi:MAG: hypothetical protein GXP13_00190 [Gammaproteobacteria bacterium]|nr:hypothetical protein [Gammaproteobacteria bacterium]
MKLLFKTYFLVFVLLAYSGVTFAAAKCLYVASYHQGYEWNDGIQRGVEKTLAGKCKLKIFYLDSKRNKKKEWIKWKAKQAVKLINEYKPDVVIVSDDNASRYLVMPYYKNKKLPFVFSGLNWSMKEYGYPYSNATGMIEVAPIKPLIKQLKLIQSGISRGVFISSDVLSEHKDYKHYKKVFAQSGIRLDAVYVVTFKEWIEEYKKSQQYDFVFIGNNAGINDWYGPEAKRVALEYTRKISVTTYDWMLPYSMLGFTKIAEEQGEWSAKVAVSILNGMLPSQIPVVFNKQWDMWINAAIISKSKLKFPYQLYKRAKHYNK